MKNMKKLASLLLALAMVLSLAVTAFAADEATGSITIKNAANVSVEGKTFNAYKILDLKLTGEDDPTTEVDERGYVYTVPTAMKGFYVKEFGIAADAGDFDAQVANKIAALKDDALFAFAAKALQAAKDAGVTPGTATGKTGETQVTIPNLPMGYYVVEDVGAAKPISALMLDSVKDTTITLKADKPTPDKNIDGNKDTDPETKEMVKYNNTSIGDTVPYVVTTKVPDMTGYTKYFFVMKDIMSKGLTFNNDVAITIGDKTLVNGTDFTVETEKNAAGETIVQVIFKNFIQYKDQTGAKIEVTYSATVNDDAVIGVVGNPNKVTLIYSNNPNEQGEGTPENPDKPKPNGPVGETPESETRTYVTEVEIIKVDNKGNRLTGAEFKITGNRLNTVLVKKDVYTVDVNGKYWKLVTGEYTEEAPVITGDETDTSKYYDSTDTKYSKSTTIETIEKTEKVEYVATVGPDGTLKFTGLAAGEYEITEIKAPAGYNLLKAPIKLTIGFTAPTDITDTDCDWTYNWSITAANGTSLGKGNTAQITVVNNPGTELPSTGGMGTTLFYILGGILMAGAAVLLITKRRMAN